ncbi:MAG: DUF4912 domain-containing protein, partial [Spirochaetaceae bacterium]|nr:DUF4912 domain-containing protein [Spirochaetaceae bacterium]
IDVPGGLERIFIIEELLDLVREDEPGGGEGTLEDPLLPEPSLLPRQYNITYLNVLIRDPLWVFVFWEIKAADREAWEKAGDFGGYFLKVFPVDRTGRPTIEALTPFVVSVGADDNSRYLGFPPLEWKASEPRAPESRSAASWFRVELRRLMGEAEIPVVQAAPFRLPALLPPQGEWSGQSRLRILSGLDDIPVLRNADRLSRAHSGQARR